jgi:tetracycline resistance efflux pump
MKLGIISLLPIVVLFVLIFTTKRMLLSLTTASIVGAILLGGFNFATVWLDKVQEAFKEGTLGNLFLLLALFGILIMLLDKSGCVMEFANWMSKFANTRKKALLVIYLLDWLICVDDYLHNMTVTTAMKKLCDKHKIPRTLLGYIVNCTAAPVCVLIPISTWAVFYSGIFKQYHVAVHGSGLTAYVSGLPYLFYAWFSVIMVLLVILGVVPLIGLTKKDNERAMKTGVVCSKEENLLDEEIMGGDNAEAGNQTANGNPIKFLIPLAIIIGITVVTKNVMLGCMGAIAATVVIILIGKTMKLTEIFDASYQGVSSMISVCCIIAIALTLVQINKDTGMPQFIVSVLTPLLSGAVFPAIVFGFCAVYSYFGGGFWDMSMVFMPIVVPIANALGMNPLLPCMALVCAATAGSTAYVAGDAMMLTSSAVETKPFYQMTAILPYAAICYGLSVVAFLIAGFALV